MVKKQSLSDKAYDTISTKIIYGDYLPGEVLSENTLSEELEMSRTPIRDALLRLSSDGFVVTMKNRGILVKEISYKEALDIHALNQWMQVFSAEQAKIGSIMFNTEELKHYLDDQFSAESNDDYVSYVRASIQFVRSMIKANNNEIMLHAYDSHREKLFRMAIVNWKLSPNEKHFTANDVNTNLYKVIVAEQFDQVKKILDDYTTYNRERFITKGRL